MDAEHRTISGATEFAARIWARSPEQRRSRNPSGGGIPADTASRRARPIFCAPHNSSNAAVPEKARARERARP